MFLREAAQQALEALELEATDPPLPETAAAMAALRAALAEPVQSGSCIACGNRMTGSPESFVVATAEVGVTAPEGYSPQQVEALRHHKGGDKTAPPLAEPVQEPVAWMEELRGRFEKRYVRDNYPGNYSHCGMDRISSGEYLSPAVEREWQEFLKARTAPPQRKPLTDEQIDELVRQNFGYITAWQGPFVRAIEAAHGIGDSK